MNNPASAILDGLSVAGSHWRLVLGILVVLFASQALLYSIFRRIFNEKFSAEEYVSLSLGGWLLPACLLSLLWYMTAQGISPSSANVVLGILLLVSLVLTIQSYKAMDRSSTAIVLSLFLLAGLFLLLRLAYVSRAIVPLYFDSPLHYQFIHELLANLDIPAGYYHRGFHFLAAFLTSITSAEITDTMLILGQVILAIAPFSAFFIVRHWTGSNSAGFFALALAAFGWYMPAHAVDWGKYPALASLALIPFVVILTFLTVQNRRMLPGNRYRGLVVLLLAGALISVLLHSRSGVIYALLAIAWMVTSAWHGLSRKPQLLLLGLLILILTGEIAFVRSQGILGPLVDAYGRKGILISASVLALSVFAWRSYPRLVFFCILSTSLLLASLFVPLVNVIPGFARTTLLDRPYVQMVLYLPLTLLGGFGLAAMERRLRDQRITWGNTLFSPGKIITGIFIALVIINGLFQYDLYPADCCAIVSRDDLAAIHWMDENLPMDALILASSTDLRILPTEEYQGSAGGDAGTWITPLTGRPVAYRPSNTDFSQQQTLEALCSRQVEYVYVGKKGSFFDDTGMSAQPDSYKILLDLPKARVYEVTGCES